MTSSIVINKKKGYTRNRKTGLTRQVHTVFGDPGNYKGSGYTVYEQFLPISEQSLILL